MSRYRSTLAVAAAGLLAAGCDYFSGLVLPMEYSSADYRVQLLDSSGVSVEWVPGVTAALDAETAVSDIRGVARFSGAATGSHVLRVTSPVYVSVERTVDVRLGGATDTLFLRRRTRPVVDTFYVDPDTVSAVVDTVWFTLSVYDSLWAIRSYRIEFGDSLSRAGAFSGGLVSVTTRHSYARPGSFAARATVYDENGDSASDTLVVYVVDNQRPVLSVTYPAPGVFYSGWPGEVAYSVVDPDSNFDHLVIDWGDASTREVYLADSGRHAHVYHLDTVESIRSFRLTVEAFDSIGASTRHVRDVTVSRVPPLVLGQIQFTPGKYIAAADTQVTIGANVLGTGGYVTQIVWQVNPGRPDSAQRRVYVQAYDAVSGAVASGGTVFTHTFATANLPFEPDSNHVRVTVTDSYGLTVQPVAWFHIVP